MFVYNIESTNKQEGLVIKRKKKYFILLDDILLRILCFFDTVRVPHLSIHMYSRYILDRYAID